MYKFIYLPKRPPDIEYEAIAYWFDERVSFSSIKGDIFCTKIKLAFLDNKLYHNARYGNFVCPLPVQIAHKKYIDKVFEKVILE